MIKKCVKQTSGIEKAYPLLLHAKRGQSLYAVGIDQTSLPVTPIAHGLPPRNISTDCCPRPNNFRLQSVSQSINQSVSAQLTIWSPLPPGAGATTSATQSRPLRWCNVYVQVVGVAVHVHVPLTGN